MMFFLNEVGEALNDFKSERDKTIESLVHKLEKFLKDRLKTFGE